MVLAQIKTGKRETNISVTFIAENDDATSVTPTKVLAFITGTCVNNNW